MPCSKPKHGPGGRVAERQDERGANHLELFAQPGPTGDEFVARRGSIGRRPALHDVGHETLRARQADLFQDELEQQSAAAADERLTALVLIAAGRLADHHQGRVQRTRADDHALTGLRERAARAGRKLG